MVASVHGLLQCLPVDSVKLFWVPAHLGIPGNEKADLLAKKAATATSLRSTVHIPLNQEEYFAHCKKSIFNSWKFKWTSNFPQLHQVKPTTQPWKLHDSLPRRFSTLLSQFRLGKTSLNFYLYNINKANSPLCPNCNQLETISHYLFICRQYENQRSILAVALHSIGIPQPDLKTLLSDHLPTLILLKKYIDATGRFR